MEQIERHKPKYSKTYGSPWAASYQINARETPDSCCKYVQRNPLTVSSNRTNRRQTSSALEATGSYHTNPYRQQKYLTCTNPTHPKYATTVAQNSDSHRYPQIASRSSKERSLNGNIAVIRNSHYKDDVDEENTKYIDDELGNFTEDNADEDGEEVEDEQEEVDETEREYEDQEVEDEVDEDTDISPQLQRMQRQVKKEAFLRAQRMRDIEQQQDLRRLRYQQQARKLYDEHTTPKSYYRAAGETETPEMISDEEAIEATTLAKSYARRSAGNGRQQTSHSWPQPRASSRSEIERFEPIRRNRGRSEVEHLPEPRAEINSPKKCSRCGGSSADRKTPLSRKTICRLQEHRDFSGKGQVGDEIETGEQPLCVRCNVKHNPEKTGGSCDFSRSGLYSLVPRRSRDSRPTRSLAYETQEISRPVEEGPEEYPSRNSRESPNIFRQKTRHSIQPSRDRTRTPSNYRV